MKYVVKKKYSGERLDKVLTKVIKGKSRTELQKMVKDGQILVENIKVAPHYFLKEGQIITSEFRLQEKPAEKIRETELTTEPKIIFENEDYIILEKPAGLLVHQTEKEEKDTLASWLIENYPQIAGVGEQKYRAGIIHRLDRDVSGIMVVCKTQKMFSHLKEQFQKRLIFKEYLALVHGKIEKDEGKIDLPIGRSRQSGKMAAHPKARGGYLEETDKNALTKYEVISRFTNYTLLKVNIKTGRTHQIRVHLNAVGHPAVGDKLYKIKRFWQVWKKKPKIDRIFLHSVRIGFKDLNDIWQEYSSQTPDELQKFIDELKN